MKIFSPSGLHSSKLALRCAVLLIPLCGAFALHAQSPFSSDGLNSPAGMSGSAPDSGSFHDNSSNPSGWTRLLLDAFQMGMRSSRFSGSGGARPVNLDSLFQMGSRVSQDLSSNSGIGESGWAGSALTMLPRLDRLEQTGVRMSENSAHGNFQFSYRDTLGRGGNAMGGEIGRGSAQATYSSPNLKNEMFHFSAAASFGGSGGAGMGAGPDGSSFSARDGAVSFGSMNGAGIGSSSSGFMSGGMNGSSHSSFGPAGSMDDPGGGMKGPGGGAKRSGGGSGPSVSLKLSF